MSNRSKQGRGYAVRTTCRLLLYLAGGWRSYQEIARECGWMWAKTAYNNVRALEDAGVPIEWSIDPLTRNQLQRVRLSADWIERSPLLRSYIRQVRQVEVA